MNHPKVLVFIDWYLPGYRAGGPVRSLANLVDHLRQELQFLIVTSDTDYTEERPYPDIRPDLWTPLHGGEQVWYASKQGRTLATWRRLLREQGPDAIYINGLYSFWSTVVPLWSTRRSDTLRIVAVRGMLAKGAMRHGRLKKRIFISMMRALGLFRGVRFQATNAEEVEDVRHWFGRQAEVVCVPNLPRKVSAPGTAGRGKTPGRLHLVSIARVAVEKNTLLAIQVLNGLKGDVTFDLYGPVYDQGYWQRCREAIEALPAGVTVRHHGPVEPTAVPDLLDRYHALLMPSAGENFGHTMLEALTAGVPLVISDRTPWRELEDAHAGADLPLERPERFTAFLQRLVDMDQEAYDRLVEGATALSGRYLSDPQAVDRAYRTFLP
ncbi:MAG: glycosyltransferase [Flavobacteriales bacterium]|nr:glycosyltransferase [Flavobacteriales bacterium]MCB9168462.1 glycosyltransferase [Flavobacteriales bacterium]